MKAEAESKTKTRVAIVLGIVAIICVAWALMPAGGPSPASGPASGASSDKGNTRLASESLDPRLRLYLLENSEKVKYEGKGTNIFRAGAEQVEISQAKISPLIRQQQEAAKLTAQLPPPPPRILLSYFGISNGKGEKPKAFLSQGDDVWIAHEGDVVNRRYRIVRISPTEVEVEDLLNNNRQTISLKQG
jgi:hypothetical protein